MGSLQRSALTGFLHPVSLSIRHSAIGVDGRFFEFGMGSDVLIKHQGIWGMPNNFGAFVLGPRSEWRPTVSDATMMISGSGNLAKTLTIHVVHVPLIPWMVLFGAGAGMLWWRLPRVHPRGHCASCGYDLSGSPGGKCPECGSVAFQVLARLLGIVRRSRGTRAHVCL